MLFMKPHNICYFFLIFFVIVAKAQSDTLETFGKPIFGTQLSISLTNGIISADSKIMLNCLSTNLSTNIVCFPLSEPKAMYEVSIVGENGKSFAMAGLAFAGDSPQTMGGVKPHEGFKCTIPHGD